MGEHHKHRKGKKDKRKDDKDKNTDNANQQIKDTTPVDTFYAQCHDISLNTDWVNVNTTAIAYSTASPPSEQLWLALNNNYTDSSVYGGTVTATIAGNNTGFGTPGKFGSHFAILNWPNISTPTTPDKLEVSSGSNLNLNFNTGFSFALWIQPKAVASLGQARFIFGKTDGGGTVQVGINTSGELFAEVVQTGVNSWSHRFSGSLVNSTWYHVVLTFDPAGAGTFNLYKDKVAATLFGTAGGFFELSVPILIGYRSNNPAATYYQGYIDEFKYYRLKILTQTEINNLFATNAL